MSRTLRFIAAVFFATIVKGFFVSPEGEFEWFDHCKKCDLDSLMGYGRDSINLRSYNDETCLNFCIASEEASRKKKLKVVDWLLENGAVIDNEVFEQVCKDMSAYKKVDLQWEFFPLMLLQKVENLAENKMVLDYSEALCHAAFHGCIQTVHQLALKLRNVNFEKLMPHCFMHEYDHSPSRRCYNILPTTPLVQAIYGGHLDVVRDLLLLGATAIEHQAGIYPASLAIERDEKDIANLLIKLGGHYEPQDLKEASPWTRAAVQEALRHRKKLEDDVSTRLQFYCSHPAEAKDEEASTSPNTMAMIMEQLAQLGYSQLEIQSVLEKKSYMF